MSGLPADLDRSIRQKFSVVQFFALPEDEAEYQIEYHEDTKSKFEELFREISPLGYRPELSGTKDECVLILRRIQAAEHRRSRIPVLLALFTLVSVVVFALEQEIVDEQFLPSFPGSFVIIGYSISVTAIMIIHELAQRFSARKKSGGRATSYLLPGIPQITSFLPSMGFAASQREPALNRDSLYDTVIAGPLAILILALVLFAVGDLTRIPSTITLQAVRAHLTNSTLTITSINPNPLQIALDAALTPWLPSVAPGYVSISPLMDGATVGFLLAFIGMLPIMSYDGGFLATAAWGLRAGRAANYISVAALFLLDTPNYWGLGLVAFFLAGRPFQLKVHDEVTPLSSSRRWITVGIIALAFLCLPIPQNLATFQLP